MRRLVSILLICFMGGAGIISSAASRTVLPDWQDPQIVAVNRLPMSSSFETDGDKLTLNGVWDFCWYETIDSRSRDFFRTDFDASGWDKMPVPGMWELNGYGDPVYVNIGYVWK